ncbi:hypothetical protein C6A87_021840 [Mycobacterium sp. ITM-2016-00317]|uniref:hypothetical protein n=1 Tax=Mycobacterium sp. ITM-2016-00317 TaxID=2099694 RepID=UPI000D475168|nr:hypothetical protein [Mycobacterium sp. ITM-2016-00317]WNG86458.1 hypothetical protein C6A87_021840 [Mycobacterium sp. ITM-2016-00317]
MTPSIDTHSGASASFLRIPVYAEPQTRAGATPEGFLARFRRVRSAQRRSGGDSPKRRYPPRRTDYMENAAMAREMYRL